MQTLITYLFVKENGEIHRQGQIQKEAMELLPVPEGSRMVLLNEPVANAFNSYFDWELQSLVEKGEAPSELHVFDFDSKAWVDPRSLEGLKLEKWAEIKAHRDEEEFGPFVYNGTTFDGDADAQRRLMVYVSVSKTAIAQGTEFSREFTLADNTVVTLQANDFVAIELAKANQVADAFAKAAMLREQIDVASSKEALEAIVWE